MSPPSDVITCAGCEERLEAWLDGHLDSVESAAVDHHVRHCPACAASVARARDVVDALHGLPELEPPARVLEEVRTATRPRGRSASWSHRPAVLAAAATLIIGLSAILVSRPTRPTEAERIERATIEAQYALGVVARAGRAAGRELGDSLDDGLPTRRTAAEIERVLDRARTSGPEVLDVHGG